MTDIHDQGRSPGKDVHYGDHGEEKGTPASQVVHPGVQGGGVELVRQPGNTAGSVARELKLTETAVRAWVKQADLDTGRRADGQTSAERAELVALRKELRETREERDILKRAVAFFARETR